jgi:Flp pilus assembly protein CpaB
VTSEVTTTARRSTLSGLVFGLVVGVPVGLGAGYGFVAGSRARNADAWETRPVLVTAKELPAGHRIGPEDLTESEWPKALVTESCATPATRERFVGQTVRWRVAPDSVLRDTDLIEPDAACAKRVKDTLDGMNGGTADVARLGTALLQRHEGAP